MSRVATFVLDTTTGRPVPGIRVQLERLGDDGGWSALAAGVTRENGEVPELVTDELLIATGEFRLIYGTGAYFYARGAPHFYPEIVVQFSISTDERYVLPLILGPFGYQTYRGG